MRGLRLGIVGAEGAKFTPVTEQLAREAIRGLFEKYGRPIPVRSVVSGKCHLGGIDIWAADEAQKAGIPVIEHPAEVQEWDPPGQVGYKVRNARIVDDSDIVVCIAIDVLPPGFNGMTHAECYHHPHQRRLVCDGPMGPKREELIRVPHHVKSGGCWTMERAKRKGKHGELIVIKTPSAEYQHGKAHMEAIPDGHMSWDANGSPV